MSDCKRLPTGKRKEKKRKGARTETIVKRFDDDGELVSETIMTVAVFTHKDDKPFPDGMYL